MNEPMDVSKLSLTDVMNWVQLGVTEVPQLISLVHVIMSAIDRKTAADLAAARAAVITADVAADAAEAKKFPLQGG